MPKQKITELENQLLSLYQQGAIESYTNGHENSLLSEHSQQETAKKLCMQLESLYSELETAC